MELEKPLVTVVIPNYNYAHFLPQCMESVVAQTYSNWELIVVDDNSSDNSREVVSRFSERHPDRDVRLIHNPHGPQGTDTPVNIGIANMRGELFAWLSSDDFFLPDKLWRQVEVMTARPEVGMVHCGVITVDDDGRRIGEKRARERDHLELFVDLFRRPEINGSTVMVRKEVFDALGPLYESHPEMPCIWRVGDHLKWMEIALHYPVAALAEPLHCGRLHQVNAPYNLQNLGRHLVPIAQNIFFDSYPPETVLARLDSNPELKRRFPAVAARWFLENRFAEKAFRYLALMDPRERDKLLAEQNKYDMDRHRYKAALGLRQIGKFEDAGSLAELSGRLSDAEGLEHYGRASWLESHGRLEEAEESFESLLMFEQERPEVVAAGAHFHLGRIMFGRGDRPGARRHLELCLRHNPAHREAGRLLERVKEETDRA